MKSKGHLYFSAFLILVSGYAIFSASVGRSKPFFFLWPSPFRFCLVVLHLYLEIFGAPEVSKGPAGDADFSGEVPGDVARHRVITIFFWIAGFILAVYLIGFPLTVPLFMFFYLRFQSEASWFCAGGHGDHLGAVLPAVSKTGAYPVRARRDPDLARYMIDALKSNYFEKDLDARRSRKFSAGKWNWPRIWYHSRPTTRSFGGVTNAVWHF